MGDFRYPGRWVNLEQEYPGLRPLLQAIGAFLEDRDRELEAYLADFARNAVSITQVSTAVWTPAAHAASHEPGGADEVDGLPGLVWRGAWSAAVEYQLRDAVHRLGSAYYCIASTSLNQAPESTPGAWSLLAQKGDTGATGPTGPQGPRGLTWKGAWSAATAYVVDDAVERNGSAYIAVAAHTNSEPPSANWNLLAAKGDTGATGATGPAGADGVWATIQDEGTPLTDRGTADFAGAGVTATDTGTKHLITIPGGPALSNDVPLPANWEVGDDGVGAEASKDDHVHKLGKVPFLSKTRTTDQVITTGTITAVALTETTLNIDSEFTVVSDTLWSPPADGLYFVSAMAPFQGTSASNRRIVQLWNNTDSVDEFLVSVGSLAAAGNDTVVLLAVVKPLLAAKQYAMRVRQDSGGNLNLGANVQMTVTYIGPSA